LSSSLLSANHGFLLFHTILKMFRELPRIITLSPDIERVLKESRLPFPEGECQWLISIDEVASHFLPSLLKLLPFSSPILDTYTFKPRATTFNYPEACTRLFILNSLHFVIHAVALWYSGSPWPRCQTSVPGEFPPCGPSFLSSFWTTDAFCYKTTHFKWVCTSGIPHSEGRGRRKVRRPSLKLPKSWGRALVRACWFW
jgi:hypothetical protein